MSLMRIVPDELKGKSRGLGVVNGPEAKSDSDMASSSDAPKSSPPSDDSLSRSALAEPLPWSAMLRECGRTGRGSASAPGFGEA